jgi:hypothetical protein
LLEAAVPGLVVAAVNPDNTPHGYNWTFAFPMLLFIVIALILYALFSRPHRRVPGRPISATAAGSRAPDAGAARAAAVAGGLSVAPGGGTAESQAEPAGAQAGATGPHGAHVTASATPAESDAADTPADDSGGDAGMDDGGGNDRGPTEARE